VLWDKLVKPFLNNFAHSTTFKGRKVNFLIIQDELEPSWIHVNHIVYSSIFLSLFDRNYLFIVICNNKYCIPWVLYEKRLKSSDPLPAQQSFYHMHLQYCKVEGIRPCIRLEGCFPVKLKNQRLKEFNLKFDSHRC